MKSGEREVAGMLQVTPETGDVPPALDVYFATADIEATVKAALDAGGTVIRKPFEIAGGMARMAVLQDPQGAVFEVIMTPSEAGISPVGPLEGKESRNMLSRRTLIASAASVATIGAFGYGYWPRLDGVHAEIERQRRLLSGDPSLQDLVRMATLAANGHNAQPWKFRLQDSGISILPDLSRRTEVVDPDDHHLFVSLGCAAENLVIAAEAHGRSTEVEMDGGLTGQIDIALGRGPVAEQGALYQTIPLRQSTRSLYDGQAVSAEDLTLLATAAQQEGVTLRLFTDAADREAVADFVVAGNSAQMDDPAFIMELRDWLRFSPDRALGMGDGLFGPCSGNPVVPEWIGPHMFNLFFKKNAENTKYRDHIRSSAGIAVFAGDLDDRAHWVKVGRSFERFALQATALGIRNAHINQPIEVLSIRPEFAQWLGMPDARPDLVVRFGRAPALPMSLRRPVADVIV
ncbi:MAG: VOC family protein [Pseudomonadota bacterium]